MRSITAPLLLSSVVLLAACSHAPWSGSTGTSAQSAAASCEVATVPRDAVYGARPGMDIATWPATAPRDGTGCQRVWYGQRSRPEAMQVLATYYYDGGNVRRLVGRVPDGAEYECFYRDGSLDAQRSRNAAQCPKASEARP
jgi:hypothetical protein